MIIGFSKGLTFNLYGMFCYLTSVVASSSARLGKRKTSASSPVYSTLSVQLLLLEVKCRTKKESETILAFCVKNIHCTGLGG